MTEPTSRRGLILATLSDLVSDFLYYDRKEDKSLPRGAIEEAIRADEISVPEIATTFRDLFRAGIQEDT
jgi:hypothetical protein